MFAWELIIPSAHMVFTHVLQDYISKKFENKQLVQVQIIKKKTRTVLNNYVRQFGKVVQMPSHGCVWIKLESKKVVKFPLEHIKVVGVSIDSVYEKYEKYATMDDTYQENHDFAEVDEDYPDCSDYPDYPEEEEF